MPKEDSKKDPKELLKETPKIDSLTSYLLVILKQT